MNKSELAKHIEHTVLKPFTSQEMVETICKEANNYHFSGICIPPCFVSFASNLINYNETDLVTVIGFPFGYNNSTTKIFECEDALISGATHVDIVNNMTWTIEGKYDKIKEEIANCTKTVKAKNGKIKWIIESGELSYLQIENLIQIAIEVGVDFIKTSTGFSQIGAELDKVEFLRKKLPDYIKIKASGGVKTYTQAIDFINAGADILGTSSGVSILNG